MWSSFSKAWPIMAVVVVKLLYYSQQVKGESPHNLPLFSPPFCHLQAIVWGEGEEKERKKKLSAVLLKDKLLCLIVKEGL